MLVELTIKTDKGEYKNFDKEFKDDKHLMNWENMMMRLYGWKVVGTKDKEQ